MGNVSAKQGWNERQKLAWFDRMSKDPKRSYRKDIASRIVGLSGHGHRINSYGQVSLNPVVPSSFSVDSHILINSTVGHTDNGKPNILITAGVHGYEPSGIEAALQFLENDAVNLSDAFNFVVYPCISPWAYEHDHRWNAYAEDPNRNFSRATNVKQIDECVHFMNSIEESGTRFAAAIDLHETPDRDIELRQERANRFGTPLEKYWRAVPQGAYLMMTKPTSACLGQRAKFATSIMDAISGVSPIAPEETLLGYRNNSGVVWAPNKGNVLRVYLGKHADQVAVTEIYPDHKNVGANGAINAQRAAIFGALKHVCP